MDGREGTVMAGWIVRWRTLDERYASAPEALDRWERLDALGREPVGEEVVGEPGRRS